MAPPDRRRNPRQELIDITLDLLAEVDPDSLSIREVARRAGLTSGAPAHHFGNKLGLLTACTEASWKDLHDAMAVPAMGGAPREGLRQKAKAYIDFAVARPGAYRLMMSYRFVDDARFPEIEVWRKATLHEVKALIRLAWGNEGDADLAYRRGLAMWALLHGHVSLLVDVRSPAAIASELTEDICELAVVVACAAQPP